MSDERTPHWIIRLRFILLCSPVGIIFAIMFAPFAIPILIAYFGTLFVFWAGSRLFTNGFVKFFDPEGYEQIKQNGGDPFYDSIGAPLNTDSEWVRNTGHEANVICPGCGQAVFIQNNIPFRCPTCDARWQENGWWRWNGSEWFLLC